MLPVTFIGDAFWTSSIQLLDHKVNSHYEVVGSFPHTDNGQLNAAHLAECSGRVGSPMELHCSSSANNNSSDSSLTYQWWKAKKMLNVTTEMIIFNSIHPSDASGYECKAFMDHNEVHCGQITLNIGKPVVTMSVCLSVCLCTCVCACACISECIVYIISE